jgi:hypothetical protein
MIDEVSKSLGEGLADARLFAKSHGFSDRSLITSWALLRMKWPPSGDAQAAEIKKLHELAATRTDAQTATARWYADHGLTEAWDVYLADYSRQVGPAQAKAAKKLLDDTLMMVNEITQTAKAAAGRTRPYVVDPTLETAVDKPGGSPSYPSGHTTAAFAAAIVLGYLMPKRAKEFLNIAMQVAYSRNYAGVHFPSDVYAGVKLASTIAFHTTAISGVHQLGVPDAPNARPRRHRHKHAA